MPSFTKTTKYQSGGEGTIIKSTRKFGIELELLAKDHDRLAKIRADIHPEFGLENDGSIRGAGAPVEIVTPVLAGQVGEDAVFHMFSKLEKDVTVNASCGLHVHVDGEGFRQETQSIINPISTSKLADLKNLLGSDIAIVVQRNLMTILGNELGDSKEDIARMLVRQYNNGVHGERINLADALTLDLPEVNVESADVDIENRTVRVLHYSMVEEKLPEDGKAIVIEPGAFDPKPDDYFVILKTSKSLENLKTLIYLHTVYQDVFMAMLPKSRREKNAYCQPLTVAFAPNQIAAWSSYEEIEKAWYAARNRSEVNRHKESHYDDSRYYTVNIHPLFGAYGTVEYRAHAATLDPRKALFWANLHQSIMDKIVAGKVSITELRKGAYITDINEKVEYLLGVLRLRTGLRKYMVQRIDYFNANFK